MAITTNSSIKVKAARQRRSARKPGDMECTPVDAKTKKRIAAYYEPVSRSALQSGKANMVLGLRFVNGYGRVCASEKVIAN
jgi:hypothetical protein